MINLEENKYMYDCGELVELKDGSYKSYPKIKDGNCSIVGKFNIGTIIIPNDVDFELFAADIMETIRRMEPKDSLMGPAPVERYIYQFLSIMDVNTFKETTKAPSQNVKRRLVFRQTYTEAEITYSVEHSRFTWSVVHLNRYIANIHNNNPLNNLSTIYWDKEDHLRLANNSFSLKLSLATRFKFKREMIPLIANNGKRVEDVSFMNVMINSRNKIVYTNAILNQIITGNINYPFNLVNKTSNFSLNSHFFSIKYPVVILSQDWDDVLVSYKFLNQSLKYDCFPEVYKPVKKDKKKDDDSGSKGSKKGHSTDNCHMCDMLLYEDIYVYIDGSVEPWFESDPPTRRPDSTDITKNNALLICPLCFHLTSFLKCRVPGFDSNLKTRVIIRTVHPRKIADIVNMIEDPVTKKFVVDIYKNVSENKLFDSRNNAYATNRRGLFVKSVDMNYIFCENYDACLQELAKTNNLAMTIPDDVYVHCHTL